MLYIAASEVTRDMTSDMTHEEKVTYGYVVTTFCSYAIYLGLVLSRVGTGALTDVRYIPILLWTAGGGIVGTILCNIVVAIIWPRECAKKDIRDRQIDRFGDYIGQSFLCIGGLAALILAMFEANRFWIANAIYLSFTLSSLLGSIAKIGAYRWGFRWG